jgi:tetratricopeptide (TPR) repeat protein
MPVATLQEPAMPPTSGHRHALVVGVNGTATPVPYLDPLHAAESGANEVAQVLRELCHFEVSTLVGEQATTEGVKKALRKLAFDSTSQDWDCLLFYFSGHGNLLLDQTDQRQVALVTHDFDPKVVKILGTDEAALSLSWLSKILYERVNAQSVLLILDCCYSGNMSTLATDRPLDTAFTAFQDYLTNAPSLAKGTRATLAAAAPDAVAWEQDSMTFHLLKVLRGEYAEAIDDAGRVTLERLQEVLRRKMPKGQELHTSGEIAGEPLYLATHQQHSARARREQRLRMMTAESSSLLQDRLASFVGRDQERADLRQKIDELLPTGGYLTITGQPGQGKSSIIAKLIETYGQKQGGLDRIAYHFIPLQPTSGHQVPLLRNLMARLILKYDLPDLYVASENLAVLSEAFPVVLKEVTTKGGREVIFIDGLDQLAAEPTGQRDLSFLPQGPGNPPEGIVFVIGTRPNDTLRPLELLKPRHSYPLRDLIPEDFDLILQHRGVTVEHALMDQLYTKLKGNALFLDLVAKELAARGNHLSAQVEEIIREIAANPENIFAISMERLGFKKKKPFDAEWREIIKPILGVLLVSCEPLSVQQIKQILAIDDEQMRTGIDCLGGLIADDGQGRFSLFHSKLYEYLHQDPERPTKEYLFGAEEEQGWHQRFIAWCEQGVLANIWQESNDAPERTRRRYARRHYITHFYQAHAWDKLFTVLDEGDYGRAKLQHDHSMLNYSLDLDKGRKAASSPTWELQDAIHLLPHLWNYTLLQCSLASRADNYPVEAFELMLLLGEEEKARGLAELMTIPERKIEALEVIAGHIAQDRKRADEVGHILLEVGRLERMSRSITKEVRQSWASRKLGKALTRAQRWRARQDARALSTQMDSRSERLSNEATNFAREQRWSEAEEACHSIPNMRSQVMASIELGKALDQAQRGPEAERIWRLAEQVSDSIPNERSRAKACIELGKALVLAQRWQEARRIWQKAEQACLSITEEGWQAEAFIGLGKALAQAQRGPEAERVWQEAKELSSFIMDERWQAEALSELGKALALAQLWQKAEDTCRSITDRGWQAEALSELGKALAQAQDWQEAERVSDSITDKGWQVVVLSELGKAMAQAQLWQEAERIWQKAEDTCRSITDRGWQTEALIELGKALAQAQRGQEADRIWQLAELLCRSDIDKGWQAEALSELGKALAQAHRWQEAERVSNSIVGGWWQAEALSELGKALAQAQDWQEAERVSDSITDKGWQAEAFSELGKAMAQAQLWQEAERIWQRAEQVSDSITDKERQAGALSELGKAMAQAQCWQEAERVSNSITDEGWRVEALSTLADTLASHRQDDHVVHLVHSWWGQAKTRDEALKLLPLVCGLIQHFPELGMALYDSFAWVDNFLRGERTILRESNVIEKKDK